MPALSSVFDRIVHRVFTGITDIAHAQSAVEGQCGIATQDVFRGVGYIAQHRIRGIQLAAIDRIRAARADPACGHIRHCAFFLLRTYADGSNRTIPGKATVAQPIQRGIRGANRACCLCTIAQRYRTCIACTCTLTNSDRTVGRTAGTVTQRNRLSFKSPSITALCNRCLAKSMSALALCLCIISGGLSFATYCNAAIELGNGIRTQRNGVAVPVLIFDIRIRLAGASVSTHCNTACRKGFSIRTAGLGIPGSRPRPRAKRHGVIGCCLRIATLRDTASSIHHRVFTNHNPFHCCGTGFCTNHNRILDRGTVCLAIRIGIPANYDGVLVTANDMRTNRYTTLVARLGLGITDGRGVHPQALDVVPQHNRGRSFCPCLVPNGNRVLLLSGRIRADGYRINGGSSGTIIVLVALIDTTIINAEVTRLAVGNLLPPILADLLGQLLIVYCRTQRHLIHSRLQLAHVHCIRIIGTVFHIHDTTCELTARLATANRHCTSREASIGEPAQTRYIALCGMRVQPQGYKIAVCMCIRTNGCTRSQCCCLTAHRDPVISSNRLVPNRNAFCFSAGVLTNTDRTIG